MDEWMKPFKGFRRMLQGDVHTEVMERLQELLRIDTALKGDKVLSYKSGISYCSNGKEERFAQLQSHTCILLVETFHHKLQVFLIVLEIVNKLVKLQLHVGVVLFPF